MLRMFYRVAKKPIYLQENLIESIEPTGHEDRVNVVTASGATYEVVSGAEYLAKEINGRPSVSGASVFDAVFGGKH